MEKEQKFLLYRIVISAILLVTGHFFEEAAAGLYISVIALLLIGYDIVFDALKKVFTGRMMDERFLMSIVAVVALFVGEYFEAVEVMLFYQIGELFGDYTTARTQREIAKIVGEDSRKYDFQRPSRKEKFITRFARIYTPVVVVSAILLAFVPPMIVGFSEFNTWLNSALSFLVVSCPCALLLSVPLAFVCTIGVASKHGILIKDSAAVEALAAKEKVSFATVGTDDDSTIAKAEIVIKKDGDGTRKLAEKLSKRAVNVARFNIAFVLVIKFAVLMLAASGNANIVAAIFADVGVSIITVLNSVRLLIKS